MYKIIVEMLEADVSLESIAQQLDLPIRQIKAIEVDFYAFI